MGYPMKSKEPKEPKTLLVKYMDALSAQVYNEIASNPRVSEPNMASAVEAMDRLIEKVYASFKLCAECESEMFHVEDDYMCIGCRSKL